jgi:hypothetical protein
MANCVFAIEALGPGEECSLVKRGLLHGETERGNTVSQTAISLLIKN